MQPGLRMLTQQVSGELYPYLSVRIAEVLKALCITMSEQ